MKTFVRICFWVAYCLCFTGLTAAAAATGLTMAKSNALATFGASAKPDTIIHPDSGVNSNAMIAKHIFMPEAYSPAQKDGINGNNKQLPRIFKLAKRQLVFSGIIASGKGRKALILDKREKDPAKRGKSRILEKGDSIMDLSIKEVGPNFVVLAFENKTMRLNLYQDNKKRPKPLPEPKSLTKTRISDANNKAKKQAKVAKMTNKTKAGTGTNKSANQAAATAGEAGMTTAKSRQNSKKTYTKTNNPFINAIKQGNGGEIPSSENNNTISNKTNPFLELIRKAREKQ